MHGGVKVYRGAAAAARAYVEADQCRIDDYYLAEGTGLAEHFTATPDGGVEQVGVLDGDGYEAWVAGLDPATGEPRGRLRHDANAVRFVEITVNGPKTWSLAAALDPDVAAAYDAAQDKAAEEIIGWVAGHATTRVGPRDDKSRSRSRRWRPSPCGITRPGPVTHTAICICRSTPASSPTGSGGDSTRSGSVTPSKRSTGSGTPR